MEVTKFLHLIYLDLTDTKVTKARVAEIDKLQKALPKCKIFYPSTLPEFSP